MVIIEEIPCIGKKTLEVFDFYQSGTIHSVFNNAINLLFTKDETKYFGHITLLAHDCHPFGITCPQILYLSSLLKPGMACSYANNILLFPHCNIMLDLTNTLVWENQDIAIITECNLDTIKKNIAFLHQFLSCYKSQSSNFGLKQDNYIEYINMVSCSMKKFRYNEKTAKNYKSIYGLNELTPLVGYGPGLTPAGDDFISGYLLSLVLLDKRSWVQEALVDWGDFFLCFDTTFFSKSQIYFSSRGYCLKSIYDVIYHIVHNEHIEDTENTVIKKVLDIGATSGYAWLLGIEAAFRVLINN